MTVSALPHRISLVRPRRAAWLRGLSAIWIIDGSAGLCATRLGNSSMITGTVSGVAYPRPSRASIASGQLSNASDAGKPAWRA